MLETRCSCRCLALALQLLFLVSYSRYTRAHLNLYITKEHMKDNLNLDFGNDMYLVVDGTPASLLRNPSAFKDFVAPFPPTVSQVKFRWRSYPLGDDEKISYSIDASSSNTEVMDTPILSISPSGTVPWYDNPGNGFVVKFPCTGKKSGFADLGFTVNYTSYGTGHRQQLKLLLRRHCLKTSTKTVIPSNSSQAVGNKVAKATSSPSRALIIGLSAAGALLLSICGCFAIYCFMHKQNKKLQMKFDYDYELKKKHESTKSGNDYVKSTVHLGRKDILVDITNEQEELLLREELDSPSNPVFIPKRKSSHRKWKRSRRRRNHFHAQAEGTPPPAYSPVPGGSVSPGVFGRALEKIPEEDFSQPEDSLSETDEENLPSSECTVIQIACEHMSPASASSVSSCDVSSDNSRHFSSGSSSDCDSSELSQHASPSSSSCAVDCLKEQKKPRDLFFKNRRHGTYVPVSNDCSSPPSSSNRKRAVNTENRSSHHTGEDNQGFQCSPYRTATPVRVSSSSSTESSSIISNESALANAASTEEVVTVHQPVDAFAELNAHWRKQFSSCLLSASQVIVDGNHPIGKGAFGRVHRGKLKGRPSSDSNRLTTVAVKIMIPSSDPDATTRFVSEALIMKNFKHENVLQLLGVVLRSSSAPLLVTAYMKHGDLNQFLRNSRSTPKRHQALSTRQLINFGLQIARGMEYLASVKYVHRDLATRNCMVSDDLTIKIADFGLARDISEEHYKMVHKTRLPIKWMALESLTDYVFSQATDVWSYGVVLWELMTLGKQPYSGVANQDMEVRLQQGHRLNQPHNCPDEIYSIMCSCWLEHPSERPLFSELCSQLLSYEAKYRKYTLDYNNVPSPLPV